MVECKRTAELFQIGLREKRMCERISGLTDLQQMFQCLNTNFFFLIDIEKHDLKQQRTGDEKGCAEENAEQFQLIFGKAGQNCNILRGLNVIRCDAKEIICGYILYIREFCQFGDAGFAGAVFVQAVVGFTDTDGGSNILLLEPSV